MSMRRYCDICEEQFTYKNCKCLNPFVFIEKRIFFRLFTSDIEKNELCDNCYRNFKEYVKERK
jgi:hypothetical protein